MADEPVEPVVDEPVEPVVTPEVVDETPQETPHPLQPGGARFEEVYARMKAAEERAARMEGMWQQSQKQQAPPPQQPVQVDPTQLQALVDQGRITPMQAADILSRQHAQTYATQITLQAVQTQQLAQKLQTAKSEVDAYIQKLPSLRDQSSPEFQKVADEAYRLSDDMGLPVTDLRVQRAALRATYGSIDRIQTQQRAREVSRDASLPHTESGVGGSRGQAPQTNGADPLKGIPQHYLDFWKSRGYSRERMVEESKYIDAKKRG